MTTKLPNITFYYQVKSSEKLLKRMNTPDKKSSYQFIQNSCSGLFGCPIILTEVKLETLLQKIHYLKQYKELINVKKNNRLLQEVIPVTLYMTFVESP